MLKKFTPLWVSFLALTICAEHVSAQSAEQYNKLGASIEVLEDQERLAVDMQKTVKDIRTHFRFLSSTWLAAGQKELPKEYLFTLDIDTQTLAKASKTENIAEVRTLLDAVKTDLALKETSAKRGRNAAEDQGATINVTVRTINAAGKEIKREYKVICNSMLRRDSPNSQFPFNNNTPSARTLPPGLYRMRIQKGDAVIDFRDIEIGDKDPVEIVFRVPRQ